MAIIVGANFGPFLPGWRSYERFGFLLNSPLISFSSFTVFLNNHQPTDSSKPLVFHVQPRGFNCATFVCFLLAHKCHFKVKFLSHLKKIILC